MKQTIFTHIALAMVLLAGLAACTDDMIELPATNGGDNVEVPDGYYFVLDTNVPQGAAQTRVAYQDIYHSYFEEDDRLGIYAIDENGNLVSGQPTNAEYRVMNVTNVVTGNVRQVLENVDPANRIERGYRYVIYYPYIEDMTINYLKSLNYGVQLDQNTTSVTPATGVEVHNALTGYEASDLLWDVAEDKTNAAGTHYVNIEMDHAMANIVFDISEEYLSANENGEYEVNILDVSRRAQGMNLTQSSSDSWKYSTGSSTTSIRMWNSGFTSSGARQFRAAIPAYQGTNGTIAEGTPFLQIKGADGTAKQFKLKSPLTLLPGKYYHFSAIKTTIDPEGPVIPDITDDDSWVLDVLDPETGQPVGLLCREYLRYQEKDDTDAHTGTEGTNTDGTATKWINSQAWVFYNLQPGTDTPELSKGKVLRFLYDIDNRYSPNGGNGTTRWPAPHYKKSQLGLFTPMHGYLWADGNESYNWDYGKESEKPENYQEYYMHGGTIYWDGEHNKIIKFELPKEDITNSQATQGHIAISQEGTVDISYENIETENAKIGIISPHFLIDTRTTLNGTTEINRYPLVKIGYNQFWMSKPLRTTIFTDGTPITCYNKTDGTMGISFNSDERIGAGYIFPFWTEQGNTTNSYDPYNNEDEMYPENTTFRPAPFYNKITIDHGNFIPVPMNDQIEYLMPGQDDIKEIGNYFGPYFAAKMCTREIAKYNGDNFEYDKYTAVCKGETYSGSATANAYVANISGLNLHALGQLAPATNLNSCSEVTANATIMLKSSQAEYVDLFMIHVYDPWNATLDVGGGNSSTLQSSNHQGATYRITQEFAQVRLFMRFKNPTAGGTSVSYHTRSASPQQPESRNVYVPLEAVE